MFKSTRRRSAAIALPVMLMAAPVALAGDNMQSAPQVAKANDAMDRLENRLIDTANAKKGAEPVTVSYA